MGPLPDRWNPVLRGDLRARTASRKLWALQAAYLGILAVLVFLGLPPELGRIAESHEPSLYVAVLWVELVLVTYLASASASQEIAVEGEKTPVDLLYAPFTPALIVAGKSLATLATIVFWLLLGLPLLVLAMAIRQGPTGTLLTVAGLVATMAWGIAQVGLLLSVVCEAEFSRTLAHWTMLAVVFVATGSLPMRVLNPIAATAAGAAGAFPLLTLAVYAILGLACAGAAYARLSSMVPAP